MAHHQEPRDGSTELGGYTWLARMIDKARLDAQGAIEEYDLEYPCPMDQGLLKKLAIEAATFQEIVTSKEKDEDILAALQARGVSLQHS